MNQECYSAALTEAVIKRGTKEMRTGRHIEGVVYRHVTLEQQVWRRHQRLSPPTYNLFERGMPKDGDALADQSQEHVIAAVEEKGFWTSEQTALTPSRLASPLLVLRHRNGLEGLREEFLPVTLTHMDGRPAVMIPRSGIKNGDVVDLQLLKNREYYDTAALLLARGPVEKAIFERQRASATSPLLDTNYSDTVIKPPERKERRNRQYDALLQFFDTYLSKVEYRQANAFVSEMIDNTVVMKMVDVKINSLVTMWGVLGRMVYGDKVLEKMKIEQTVAGTLFHYSGALPSFTQKQQEAVRSRTVAFINTIARPSSELKRQQLQDCLNSWTQLARLSCILMDRSVPLQPDNNMIHFYFTGE